MGRFFGTSTGPISIHSTTVPNRSLPDGSDMRSSRRAQVLETSRHCTRKLGTRSFTRDSPQGGMMSIREFIRQNRSELDAAIRRACPNIGALNDDDRRQWIANDEGLYKIG